MSPIPFAPDTLPHDAPPGRCRPSCCKTPYYCRTRYACACHEENHG